MQAASKPIGIALILCDQVITDARTNKKSLIGVFNNIAARVFPCRHPRLCAFVSITGGHGKAGTEVRCVAVNGGDSLFAARGEVDYPDPNHVVEAVFEFNSVTFPEPGLYSLEVLSDDEIVLERRFTVRDMTREDME